jgi:SNF2 family DNA or RNA helicase
MEEEAFTNEFVKVTSTSIVLHKEILEEDIRLVSDYQRFYVVDKNDFPANHYYVDYFRIPKTSVQPLAGRFTNYGSLHITYPYLNYRTIQEMQNDHTTITSRNKFLTNTYLRATIIARLEKLDDAYYISYYVNKRIPENLLVGNREAESNIFRQLVSEQKKQEIIRENQLTLKTLLLPARKIFGKDGKIFEKDAQDNILKQDIKLFDYQVQDVQWMQELHNNILTGNNVIHHSFKPTTTVFNDQLALIDENIFPAHYLANNPVYTDITYYGGNIVSEVGLGKTIVSLYYILKNAKANREAYNQFVTFGNTCNYAYKRGANKGKSCSKSVVANELYCKEHSKSIFVEKRDLVYRNLDSFIPSDFMISGLFKTNSTLIICPNQLCDQWTTEYYSKFKNDHRVLLVVTRDQFKNLTLGDILFSDLVIVSYQFLTNRFYETKNCEIYNTQSFKVGKTYKSTADLLNCKDFSAFRLYKWNNVFLDEAHEIQNMAKSSDHIKTISQLKSNFKWNISGTPFANGLSSFLHLLTFNTSFKKNVGSLEKASVSAILQSGLNSALIQDCKQLYRCNTKESVKKEYSGNFIEEKIKLLEFTSQERTIYNSHLAGSRSKYSEFLIKLCCHPELHSDTRELIQNCKSLDEIQEVMLNYNNKKRLDLNAALRQTEQEIQYANNELDQLGPVNEFNQQEILLRNDIKLRLGNLKRKQTTTKKEHDNIERTCNYLKQAIESLGDDNADETCPICLDELENKCITKCGHKFCWECIYETHVVKSSSSQPFKCPTCNTNIATNEIYLYKNQPTEQIDCELDQIVQTVKSTKIGNIIHYLKTETKPEDKIIVFSQWDEILHKVGNLLENHKLKLVYCQGSVYKRKRSIDSFSKQKDVNIIMLSSRNAASGINLTAANKIILLEPVYGSSEYRKNIESQAVGRADRIGQRRPIEVERFIIKNTIEEDIINDNIDESKLKQMNI